MDEWNQLASSKKPENWWELTEGEVEGFVKAELDNWKDAIDGGDMNPNFALGYLGVLVGGVELASKNLWGGSAR